MPSSDSRFIRIATLVGGRTKKKYRLFWNRENHYVYQEVSGFFSSSMQKTELFASSESAAFHVAEMWAFSH